MQPFKVEMIQDNYTTLQNIKNTNCITLMVTQEIKHAHTYAQCHFSTGSANALNITVHHVSCKGDTSSQSEIVIFWPPCT